MPAPPARPIIGAMTFASHIAASSTSWPDAAIAIAGIALVASISIIVVWQALATWRARIAVSREEAYRKLAEQTARDLQEIHDHVAASGR
jgi:hypothetical protein